MAELAIVAMAVATFLLAYRAGARAVIFAWLLTLLATQPR